MNAIDDLSVEADLSEANVEDQRSGRN